MICSSAEDRRAQPQRWFALLIASVLLHMVVFNWASGRLGFPSLHDDSPETVTTVLLPAPPAAPQPVASAKPKAKRKRAPAAPPAPAPVLSEPAADTAAAPVATETPDSSAEAAVDIAETIASAAGEAAEQPTHYTVVPPPSAELQYDVRALMNGQESHGVGAFRWEAAGNSYSLTATASAMIIFIKLDLLNFRSEGAINEFGIAPVLYSEKKIRRSMTNTHFRHAERVISFSASEATYPYNGGEQDRATVIWQLAGIGRGDATQFMPGAEIDIFVAGARKAESWRFQVIGEEEIDTPHGKLMGWHVMRTPRPGSYDEQIDIWLAPQQEWYPAKVRYTYTNGNQYELSLSGIAPLAAQ